MTYKRHPEGGVWCVCGERRAVSMNGLCGVCEPWRPPNARACDCEECRKTGLPLIVFEP